MPQRGAENPLTRIGMTLVEHAAGAEVQIVSYFCRLGRLGRVRAGEPIEAEGLTAMLYALIHQMVRLLPPEVDGNVDLSEERFRLLDGTEASWTAALGVLGDVMGLIARPVYCVLDGVQWLEHGSTNECLKLFLDLLLRAETNILFITTGTSPSLRDAVSRSETLGEGDIGVGTATENLQRHGGELWA